MAYQWEAPKYNQLLSAQGNRGAYRPGGDGSAAMANAVIGGTQNWGNAAASAGAAKASVETAQIQAPTELAAAGLEQAGRNLAQITAAAGGLMQQGSANQTSLKIAQMEVDSEKESRRLRTMGAILGYGTGITQSVMARNQPVQQIQVVLADAPETTAVATPGAAPRPNYKPTTTG